LSGPSSFTVDGLAGDILAGGLTGTLDVTTVDDASNAIAVTTGSNNTSIVSAGANDAVTVHAATLGTAKTLTLSGPSSFTVDGLAGEILAGGLTGTLDVTTVDDASNAIAVTTGSNNTSIVSAGANDAVTVHAASLCTAKSLTLSGPSSFTVDGLAGDILAGG